MHWGRKSSSSRLDVRQLRHDGQRPVHDQHFVILDRRQAVAKMWTLGGMHAYWDASCTGFHGKTSEAAAQHPADGCGARRQVLINCQNRCHRATTHILPTCWKSSSMLFPVQPVSRSEAAPKCCHLAWHSGTCARATWFRSHQHQQKHHYQQQQGQGSPQPTETGAPCAARATCYTKVPEH